MRAASLGFGIPLEDQPREHPDTVGDTDAAPS
jgi:hypothetical protein